MLEEFRFVLQKLLCKPLYGLHNVEFRKENCVRVFRTQIVFMSKATEFFGLKISFLLLLYLSLILMLDPSFLLLLSVSGSL